jgi:hypothetical protein
MNKCLFCSNKADSLEHVLPQWLFRCVSPATTGKFTVRVGRYVRGEGYLDDRKHLSLSFKARIVCRSCNGGWMSKLESKISYLLKPLLAEEFPTLGHIFLENLKQDAQPLALWLSKTALTTSLALPGNKRLPSSFADEVALLQPPAGVWVDIAKARATGIGAAFTKMFATFNGNDFVPSSTHSGGGSFQFCLQINRLLMRVGMSPGARVGYRTKGHLIPFRLYPSSHVVPDDFEFQDLSHFCHCVFLRTWNSCQGEVPPPFTLAQP